MQAIYRVGDPTGSFAIKVDYLKMAIHALTFHSVNNSWPNWPEAIGSVVHRTYFRLGDYALV